jgi:hypothetical protein
VDEDWDKRPQTVPAMNRVIYKKFHVTAWNSLRSRLWLYSRLPFVPLTQR